MAFPAWFVACGKKDAGPVGVPAQANRAATRAAGSLHAMAHAGSR
ncbi:hypothetical protein DWUX_2276 [Desulfovibrio diazotrophicus]|nr:hypothetical protein DWUX_2276 [Desulfovibrio diazotrophicus]